MNANIDNLTRIFDENSDKRICVLGTTCTGKSTLISQLGIGEDMDELLFPLLAKEEKDYVCQTPWTEEIGEKMDELVRTKLIIKPGIPLFGTVLVNCDLIIYLHIDDDLLFKRTALRNVDFKNAKMMQSKIEQEIYISNIETIVLEVLEKEKTL